MEEKNPVKSFESAKGINPSKYFDRIRFRDVAGLLGAILVLVFVIGVSSVSYKLHKESTDALDNHARVEENTELTYYLTVKEDGVDSTGKSSSDSTIANVSGGLATITDQIPAGLELVGFTTTDDGTIGATARSASASSCAGHVIDDTKEAKLDGGTWNDDHTAFFYHGLHYDASSRTVSFKVENIQAGCDLTVGIITTTPSLGDADRKDFYNTANLAEDTLSLNSNTMHVWMGRQGLTTYDVVYQYTGDVPDSAPAAPETQSFTEGATVSVATSPKASGYQFSGWQTSDTPVSSGSFTMPATNVTFTGSFSAQPEETKYSVTYVIDGDAPADYVAPKTRSYPAGTDVTLDAMSKNALVDDYSFNGWTSEDIMLGEKGFTMPARNIEIHGSFTRKTYKVTYAFEGATLPPNADSLLPAEQSYPAGTKVTLADNPTAEGYVFTGWYQTDTFAMPAEDITIYGEWSLLRGTFSPEISVDLINPEEKYHKGDTVKFRIAVKNTADFSIRDVQVVEHLPEAIFLDGDNYSKKTDAFALIPEIPAGETVTLEAEYTVMENADAVYTNTVVLAGALADDGYSLNLETEYLAEIDFETEFVENLPPSEEEEKEQEAENAATLDKIARYIIAGIVGLAGSIASFFMLRKTIKNEQLTSLKKQIQRATKAKRKHPISPETARRRLIVFAAADIALVAGCIALAIHMAPKIQEKQNDPDIHLMSGNADFDNEEAGAWQLTKSAKWTGDGKAEVTMTIDTKKKTSNKKKDIVFAVDVSGSMMGNKLDQVKADMTEVVADVLNDSENQVSLISFESTANLELPFTSDKELALSAIENLETGNNTDYYEALQRVEEALAGYTQDENRELYVLILTDGFPTVDSPNEVREYQYLKELYPYATFGAIQYEMGSSSVYDPITRISDEQFIADMSSLHNTLFDVVAFPFTYTTMDVTDYINTDYFALDENREIEASLGEATAQDNTISWTLGGKLRSGDSATITIPIKLKEELRRTAGEYPTNAKETVLSDIYEVGEDEQTSTETPVLKNNYTVTYEANAPADCTVSGLPESENYFVFEVVEINDTVPTCAGYNFAGYVITTEDVYRLNSDYFRMPASDVVIKATWTKASIEKTMDGTVHVSAKLYDEIAKKTNGPDAGLDYYRHADISGFANGRGVNTVESSLDDEHPIYYYRGAVTDNNVLFADFCWKAVRTTETGGVKLIYNGAPNAGGQCMNKTSNTAGITDIGESQFNPNDNSPAYAGYMYGNVYASGNRQHGSSNVMLNKQSLNTSYWYADTAIYDTNLQKWTLVDPYQVSSTEEFGSLVGKYTFGSKEQSTTGYYTQYIAAVDGSNYFYITLNGNTSLDSENKAYTYGDNYTVNNGVYIIDEPNLLLREEWYSRYNDVKGKYVCAKTTSSSCRDLWYILAGSNSTNMFYVQVKNKYKFANTVSFENGSYILDASSTIEPNDPTDGAERASLNNAHYTCFSNSSKCATVSYVYGFNNSDGGVYHYINLQNGIMIEDAISDMKENTNDSIVKTALDEWYEDHIDGTSFELFLEDTVFCNDRSMLNVGGWNPNGGSISSTKYQYSPYRRSALDFAPSLVCNDINDTFSVGEQVGNGKLKYPIGLLSADEIVLAGNPYTANNVSVYSYLNTGAKGAWSISPAIYDHYNYPYSENFYFWGNLSYEHSRTKKRVRPVVSVIPDIRVASGDGTMEYPWELELPATQQNSNP